MRGSITAVILAVMGVGGCAHPQARRALPAPPYFVPTAAIVQMPGCETPAQPGQILPESDGDYYLARGERTAIGNVPLAEYSAFSIYTYDAQEIGVPGNGFGFRYRWILRQGYARLAP
jgi:hypothetical protein